MIDKDIGCAGLAGRALAFEQFYRWRPADAQNQQQTNTRRRQRILQILDGLPARRDILSINCCAVLIVAFPPLIIFALDGGNIVSGLE